MAEKPRLKKTGDILGSITPEPARGKRAGGRASDKDEGQARRGQDARIKSAEEDYLDRDEENIELTDGPVLPSAQSLAEKLMPKKPAKNPVRHLDFRAPAPKPAKIEFDEAPASGKAAATPMEFQAAPGAAETTAIEFGVNDTPAPEPPPRQPAPRAPRPAQQQAAQRQAAPAARPAPPPREPEAPPAPVVAEYTFQSFEDNKPSENADTVWEFSAQPQAANERGSARRGQAEQDAQQPPPPPPPRRERIIQPLRTEAQVRQGYAPPQEQRATAQPPGHPGEDFPPAPQPQQAPPPPPPPPEPEISEAERNRQDFLKRIANQFELQFEEKFEDGALRPRENIPVNGSAPRRENRAPREPLFAPEIEPRPQAPRQQFAIRQQEPDGDGIDGEDFLSYIQRRERERGQKTGEGAERKIPRPDAQAQRQGESEDEPALGFIEKFEQNVREEEQQRSEDFKETISQKFMRERERYLKELQIDTGEPGQGPEYTAPERDAAAPAPARRKLDFQIQPEMHMQNDNAGETPAGPRPAGKPAGKAVPPMTYTRGGAARPQVDTDDEPTAAKGFSVAPAAPGGKKTGEQLLLEHTMRTRMPAVPAAQPEKLKFTFETPEEHAKKAAKNEKQSILPTEKWPRRIVFIAMAAGLFSLGLVGWSMASYYNLSNRLAAGSENPISEPAAESIDTLDVYNDRAFTQTASINNVVFKYAGTLLKNAHVSEYILIEGVEGAGGVRLEDVTVDSAISVKASSVDAIDLHNVNAPRVIINNPTSGMTVNVTGNTDIGVVELRTKSTVKQSDIGSESTGIGGMLVTSHEEAGEIDAVLDGLNLRTLETEAGTAILTFENNTRAESLSANGSLSLSGDGRVSTLSIGSKIGQGAGDIDARRDVILFVKGVAISNLNVKSPATLNLSTSVDSISTADAITLGGEAQVGSLTLNPNTNYTSRLLVDIVSANIQTVYSNTQSRINVTGASRINELIADDSTYALGNKVNHLKVNADGVIYENKPDNISLASGVRPPQSKADNPNIDYNLATAQPNPAPDVAGGDFATTCGHSRESGAFLVGDGSKDSPYEVSTAMQLAHAGLHPASHFIQTADIDISSESALASNFPPIGSTDAPFEGVFDGRGFAVSRLKINSQAESVGLFGANKGLIQNVHISSGEISATSTSPGFAGGIAGLNYDGGQIRSCSNGANVNGGGNARTGGVAGGNYGGRIHDCYNSAKVTGADITGGITGLNRQGASVTGSYNAGVVEGGDNAGAVAGVNEDGVIANCYYLDDSSYFGIGSGGGTATERTSKEMASAQMAADLSAGNETSLWIAGSTSGGYSYPVHRKPE